MLVIVCGLPGSGKSSFSRKLARQLPAVHLNSDVIRKELFPNPNYTQEEKEKVYHEMAKQAEDLLRKGENVILDATFYRREYRDQMRGVAKNAGKKSHTMLCSLGERETEGRLKHRKSNVSDADYEVYLKLKEQFEPIKGKHLVVDSSLPLSVIVRHAIKFIEGN